MPDTISEPHQLLLQQLATAEGAACIPLIDEALTSPHIYVFGEILQLASVQQLAKNEAHAGHVRLLQLFSYGTLQDYRQQTSSLPALTAPQLNKLRQLTLVSLAAQYQTLGYEQVMEALQITEQHDLESLVIEAIYSGILNARLDQQQRQLHVEYVMGRDLAPGQLDSLISSLDDWCQRIDGVLQGLNERTLLARQSTATSVQTKITYEDTLAEVKELAKQAPALPKRSFRSANIAPMQSGRFL